MFATFCVCLNTPTTTFSRDLSSTTAYKCKLTGQPYLQAIIRSAKHDGMEEVHIKKIRELDEKEEKEKEERR